MARIRTIKPEFPQSESVGRVSREARLCFILLWTISDDFGRLRGNSRILASLLYPYDDDAFEHIDTWLSELEREECIVRYQEEGNTYVQITQWHRHQRVDKPTASKIPEFRESSRILARPPVGKGRERKGKEEYNPPTPQGDVELPEWIPIEVWNDFRETRKRLRAPMTAKAERLAITELDTLRKQGNDPKAVLEQSIMRGWKGLFPLKAGDGGSPGNRPKPPKQFVRTL